MSTNDTQSKIGKLIEDPNEQRDAIHIAVAPCTAIGTLYPGVLVEIVEGNKARQIRDGDEERAVGIVDPFYRGVKQSGGYYHNDIEAGQRVWIFLFPNTIADMRHHWVHPAFEHVSVVDDPRHGNDPIYDKARAHLEELAALRRDDLLGVHAGAGQREASGGIPHVWLRHAGWTQRRPRANVGGVRAHHRRRCAAEAVPRQHLLVCVLT
jgi:hypothetical protein